MSFLEASRRSALGFVLHASSNGFAAQSESGAFSVKSMSGGTARYTVGRSEMLLDDGAYTLLNDAQPYSVEVAPGVESFCLFFDAATVRGRWQAQTVKIAGLLERPEATETPLFFERRYESDNLVTPWLNHLRAGNRTNRWSILEWDDLVLETLDRLFAAHHLELAAVDRLSAARPATRQELYRRLHRARDWLEANLANQVSLERVAGVAELSPFHLQRSFKAFFRESPARFVTRRRLERARFLLAHSDRSVLDICLDVGFESLGSFAGLFRRVTGLTPAAYRALQSDSRKIGEAPP